VEVQRNDHIAVWYSRIDYESSLQFATPHVSLVILTNSRKVAVNASSLQCFPNSRCSVDGQHRIKDDPRLIMPHLDDRRTYPSVERACGNLPAPTVQEDRRRVSGQIPLRGSCCRRLLGWAALARVAMLSCCGNDSGDPLLLQIKQAQPSVLERHLGQSLSPNHAQRVVCGGNVLCRD